MSLLNTIYLNQVYLHAWREIVWGLLRIHDVGLSLA